MDRDELLGELTQDVFAYVMHGTFSERRFVGEIRPSGLGERFEDFESLVRLHFVLRPEVVDFVEQLPRRIRSVKTQTEDSRSRQRGHASGRVDWSATVRERYSRAPGDKSLFVCENRTENYDVPENIVLKRILSLVHRTLVDCQTHLQKEYDWVTDRWKENLELAETLIEIFERNVHVTRIRDPTEYEPTERMLRAAEESRSEIYRDAARLLREYHDAARGDEDAIRDLLASTAITPDDDETLLELFVLFKYIRVIEELQDENFTLRTIESGTQEIARLQGGDSEFVLYHDRSGRSRGLSFTTAEHDKPRAELGRAEMVKREAQETTANYFRDDDLSRRSNRPDVIVLEVRGDDRREYLITEVKNSTRRETIRQGIEETLEYVAFLRQDGEFVFDRDTDFFGSGWNGLLVVQDLKDMETARLEDQQSIRILQASEVSDRLRDILLGVLSNKPSD
ncbi:hypothetical protein [Halomarina litorea]|uniref:hypothetical protein n=1 Tax=Halomarina litorea TaxID=2961595 RepID=UPI0020C2CB13|nr:hypothetical protein [Halomarina sp. BCD28]